MGGGHHIATIHFLLESCFSHPDEFPPWVGSRLVGGVRIARDNGALGLWEEVGSVRPLCFAQACLFISQQAPENPR